MAVWEDIDIVCWQWESHSRPEAEAVGGVGDHHLTEGWHYDQDKDGHDLDKESKASLQDNMFTVTMQHYTPEEESERSLTVPLLIKENWVM